MVPSALVDCETTKELVVLYTGIVTPLVNILSISSLTAYSWFSGNDLVAVLLGGTSLSILI